MRSLRTVLRRAASRQRGALEELDELHHPELLIVESGDDNLAARNSRELADDAIYIIDVAGCDKVPRKGGPGLTQSDLVVINKTDLAPLVGADLGVMERDARRMRGEGPFLFVQTAKGVGVPEIARHVFAAIARAGAGGKHAGWVRAPWFRDGQWTNGERGAPLTMPRAGRNGPRVARRPASFAPRGANPHVVWRSPVRGGPSMPVPVSGASTLPLVEIDTHSAELVDDEGAFIGDKANRRAFNAVLDDWRNRVKAIVDEDPFSDTREGKLSKKALDRMHREGDPLEAGILHTAIEEFANELADVTLRFLELPHWQDTQRIVVGGGLSWSRVGDVIVGRTAVLVKAAGHAVRMAPIRNHPDEAALLGAAQLAPAWALRGHDALLAVDIGGSNIRAGLVELHLDDAPDLSEAKVHTLDLWRWIDEPNRPTREETVARLAQMLGRLRKRAKKDGLTLAPLLGVACPGEIDAEGHVLRGGQNLPGDWHAKDFNLARELAVALPTLGGQATQVVIQNDAVVQGLSEVPFMRDVEHWGVLTIGTGLGNAHFTNRRPPAEDARRADDAHP